jgi:acyl-CoA synthetase (AMP-forming)/AMP-acid ligase II
VSQSLNIAALMEEQAALRPDQAAVVAPDGRGPDGQARWATLSFRDLNAQCDAYARGLVARGVRRGDRVSLLIKPSLHFIPLVFAVFKVGALPVLIDPGMGLRGFLRCVGAMKPTALIGEPVAVLLSRLFPGAFGSVRLRVTTGRGRGLGWGLPAHQLAEAGEAPFPTAVCAASDEAAILFTSGSTGPAKGVTYTHGIFNAQTRYIQQMYGIEAGEVDLACFPMFGLFTMAMGCTVVFPDMDVSKPGKTDPHKLVEAIEAHRCTSAFGSPAIWRKLAEHGRQTGLKLPTLRRILMAGAPIPVWMHEAFQEIFDGKAELHTPYGATESLPVSSIGSKEVLSDTAARTRAGAGTCVGRPAPGCTVRIIRISDGPIPQWDPALELPPGQIGEVLIESAVVTPEYKDEPAHTAAAKIRRGDTILHRIGDLGYIDPEGRLWFCGRKSHRVEAPDGALFCSEPMEGIFNEHPAVLRTALVGVGGQPGLVVELRPEAQAAGAGAQAQATLVAALRTLGQRDPLAARITRFWVHPAFPVDTRHNAKIDRTALAAWAAGQAPIAGST